MDVRVAARLGQKLKSMFLKFFRHSAGSFESALFEEKLLKTLILKVFEANSAASLNYTFFEF